MRKARKPQTNISKAFTMLRRNGYFARQHWWCCSTCGWYDVPAEKAKKAVFYHLQDSQDLEYNGTCYLCWSGDGNFICSVMRANGVIAEWDGKEESRIKIDTKLKFGE